MNFKIEYKEETKFDAKGLPFAEIYAKDGPMYDWHKIATFEGLGYAKYAARFIISIKGSKLVNGELCLMAE